MAGAEPKKQGGPLGYAVVWGTTMALAGSPFDRIQLLLQCEGENIKNNRIKTPFKDARECLTRSTKVEGNISLFRGAGSAVAARMGAYYLAYSMQNRMKDRFEPQKGGFFSRYTKFCAAGGILTLIPHAAVYPFYFARVRLANDVTFEGSRMFRAFKDVWSKVVKTDGVQGLYRGFSVSCLSVGLRGGALMGLYYALLTGGDGPRAASKAQTTFTFLVTIMTGLAVYPLETVRVRMMMTSGEAVKYKGWQDCYSQITSGETGALFKGVEVYLVRHIIGFVVVMSAFWILKPRGKKVENYY